MIKIVSADTPATIQEAITLSQEYVTWMVATIREQYPDLDVPEFTSEHDYDDVSKKFPGEHVPPYGRLLLAMNDEQVGGCIALAKLSDTVCEMRTLYVRPAFRGRGLAKKLVETVLYDARTIGYHRMRLDTLGFMDSAQGLYRSFGFQDIPPYLDMSESLKQHICFLELDLRK